MYIRIYIYIYIIHKIYTKPPKNPEILQFSTPDFLKHSVSWEKFVNFFSKR